MKSLTMIKKKKNWICDIFFPNYIKGTSRIAPTICNMHLKFNQHLSLVKGIVNMKGTVFLINQRYQNIHFT